MSSAESILSVRDYGVNVLERGREQISTIEVYRNGALVAPADTGTYRLLDPSGDSIAAPAFTETGKIGIVTLTAALLPATLALGEGYQEEWTLQLADPESLPGVERVFTRPAAVALHPFYPVLTDLDLQDEYPDLNVWLGSVITNWQKPIDQAWKKMITLLRQAGHFPYLIMDPGDFREPHKELAFYFIFKWMFLKQSADQWKDLMAEHKANFNAAWGSLNFVVDLDHDGIAETTDRTAASRVTHLNASPRRRTSKDPRW